MAKIISILIICAISFIPVTAQAQTGGSETIGNNLNLDQAICTALKNNPNVDAMLRTIEKSEYLYKAASKEWLPAVTLDYTFTGFPTIPELTIEGTDTSGGSDKTPLTDSTSFVLGAHVKMPIYTAGAIESRKDMAKFGVDVARLRYLETRADFIQEVTINYLNVLRLQNYSVVTFSNLKRFIEHEDNTSAYFETGLVAKNALLEIRSKRSIADQDVIEVEKDLRIARAALNVTMGVDIESEFILADVTGLKEVSYSIGECFELAKENNPSLSVYAYLKRIAAAAIDLERSDMWPHVFGEIDYFKHGKTPALRGDDYLTNDIVMGVVKADWKVFDWFKTVDLVKARKKEAAILADKMRSVEDKVALDIRQSYLSMKAGKNKLAVAERAIEYAEENYRISKLRYEERVAKSTEVNDALVLLERSKFNYYAAFYEYSVSIARLERVVGLAVGRYE